MWLLLLMIIIMPFETSPYLKISDSFLGVFQDFTVIKLLGMIGFAWAVARIAQGEGGGLLSSAQARTFLVLYAGVLFAGLLSGSGFLVISRYLAFFLFMPFVLVTVKTHEDLRRLVYAIALAFILVFPYAVRQMLRYESRLGVGVSETNYFAANLVLVIPIAFAIAATQLVPWKRRLWVASAVVLVFALFLTSSRGGFLGLLVASVVWMYRRRGFGASVALVAVLIVAALPTGIGYRMFATLTGAESDVAGLEASNRAHTALFWAGLRMVADAPITGVGPQNFKAYSLDYAPELTRGYIAHNTYLELAAETGLPVLMLFLLLLWHVFRTLNRATTITGSREGRELATWADGLRSGLLGFTISASFISAQYEKMFWLVVFASIVVERLLERHERRVVEAPELREAPPLDVRFGEATR
jgi:O-antigen ligase